MDRQKEQKEILLERKKLIFSYHETRAQKSFIIMKSNAMSWKHIFFA